jgi:hypothetical protein
MHLEEYLFLSLKKKNEKFLKYFTVFKFIFEVSNTIIGRKFLSLPK